MSDTPTHTGVRAIFLSYAREDAEAARRIAEALRGFGLEVWFDMNELRGGDAWDSKIRGQIKSCALFVPLISQRTEERTEGYFRREWKLAVDRTHDMAGGRTFIVPVVIDDTAEAESAVPEEFMRYQWTRLVGGEPTPDFVAQVKRLLEAPRKPTLKVEHAKPPTLSPFLKEAAAKAWEAKEQAAVTQKRSRSRWTVGALVAVVIGVAVAMGVFRRPAPASSLPSQASPPAAPEPSSLPSAPAAKPADKSIAVIPFTNMSEEKDSAFFTDGIHEDILTNLALVRELRVVSRTSVMAYRATTKPMKQIAQELGVTYILEGSVRRAGNKVRVTGQLIHAATDEHVWAQSYDRDLTDVFAIQAELSQQIAAALKTALSPEEKALIARKPTENPAAYDLFLRSRDLSNREGANLATRQRRVTLLESAVTMDPKFAQAWGELAAASAFLVFGNAPGRDAILARAKQASEKALQLAPEDPDVIGSYGTYLYYGFRDYAGATAQYRRLAALQPNSPVVYNSLALIQRRQGQWAESLANARRASQLDPGNLQYWRNLLATLRYGRRWPEAIDVQNRIAAMLPDVLLEKFEVVKMQARATGSFREGEEFFRAMSREELESPEILALRKDWAEFTDQLEEFVRLDRLSPYFDGYGVPRSMQALRAALNYYLVGDKAGAVARLGEHTAEIRKLAEAEPNNVLAQMSVATLELINGRPEAARRQAEKAAALLPESKDALEGPRWSIQLAMFCDLTGDHERALAEYKRLLSVPSMLSVEGLKLDKHSLSPALRKDPRFQALLADPKNNEPLF
ncbi:TIR domain-containing protein [Oleiharenicola lentus]|uniref:TIR domain-containing protein n=1 Tax=Oleiharenicola lentus TaxID=2508720 RepID=A0A4Q1C7F6_9BACT|nr:TIR domain-containing protein [Oleiharenicola lentus]RXK54746.1 TIR domain-containing protein [Oleiharenicola lentus]